MGQTKIKYYQLDLNGQLLPTDIEATFYANIFLADGSHQATGAFDLNNHKITNLAAPTAATDAATKGYVDGIKQGLDIKDSVTASSTGNVNISNPGTSTFDGYTVSSGNRILLMNQTNSAENGIYIFNGSGSAMTRSSDADSNATIAKVTIGLYTFIEYGTTMSGNGYVLSTATADPIIVGTTGLTFTQFSGAGQITAGAGLYLTGNTINIGTVSTSRIVLNADTIDLATISGLTAGSYGNTSGNSYPYITVDAYGRITAVQSVSITASSIGAQPLSGDLTALSGLSGTGIAVRTGTGTWSLRSLVAPSAGITISNADGVSGNPTFTLANDLGAIEALSSTGFAVRTAADSWAQRSMATADSSRITISNGNGVSGNPTFDLAIMSGLTASTYTKVTVDVYGRVTAGTTLTLGDLPSGLLTTASYVNNEVIVPNGSAGPYTIANTPITGTETLTVNGQKQTPGSSNDYTISGTSLTFTYIPKGSDSILITYFK